jgi:hypothetical protein
MKNSNSQKWIDVMNEEMKSMYDNDVWDIVPLSKDKKTVGCKWIFKTKWDSKGNVKNTRHALLLKISHRKKALIIQKLSLQFHRKIP